MFETSIRKAAAADNLEDAMLAREFSRASDARFQAIHDGARSNLELAMRMIDARRRRSRDFGASLFSDPAWDILLTLYVSRLQQARLKITCVADESGVPTTTVLRWINALHDLGLIVKSTNPTDARSTLVELSDKAAMQMTDHLSSFRKSVCAKADV